MISNGRLEFGIGAGWKENEYLAYGFPFPKPAVRIAQLREAVTIIRKMWTEEKPSFKGKYYEIKEALCDPKPVQKPHPPIWIGGEGEKLTLRVVAELADGCNWYGTPEEFAHKLNVLKKHCAKVGRNSKIKEYVKLGVTRFYFESSTTKSRAQFVEEVMPEFHDKS